MHQKNKHQTMSGLLPSSESELNKAIYSEASDLFYELRRVQLLLSQQCPSDGGVFPHNDTFNSSPEQARPSTDLKILEFCDSLYVAVLVSSGRSKVSKSQRGHSSRPDLGSEQLPKENHHKQYQDQQSMPPTPTQYLVHLRVK